MEVTSLVDHVKTTDSTGVATERGLSLHVKCDGFSILFDTGSSGHFLENATPSPDDFSHELAMAVETDGGIVVFSGSSHHGALNILAAVRDALPDRRIKALFGRFHLVNFPLSLTLSESRESVRALGRELLQYRIEKFYTSHCAGSKGYGILKEIMGETLAYFSAGSRAYL
jgi:metal-dependent hydrolase (beta-lactamase superfamily II)